MVQNSLVKYIQQQIRDGYSSNAIKQYLIKYGYTESQINEALQFAYPPSEVKHVLHLSKTTIIMIIAIFLSLALATGAFLFFTNLSPAKLLDIKINLINQEITEGNKLYFTTEISNLGKARRFDVELKHEVYNLKDQIIIFKEETLAVETRATTSVDIDLNAPPGNYYIRTTATYGKNKAKATQSFKIVSKSQPIEPEEPKKPEKPRCPSNCNDGDSCTRDHCSIGTNYQCQHDLIEPCCGNGKCERSEDYTNCIADCDAPAEHDIFTGMNLWEKIDAIKEIAKRNKQEALNYCKEIEQTILKYDCIEGTAINSKDEEICNQIEDVSHKDGCYREFAVSNQKSQVCDKVEKESKKDQCYMVFVTKGDYSICDKLVNKHLRQSCQSLKQLEDFEVPDFSGI